MAEVYLTEYLLDGSVTSVTAGEDTNAADSNANLCSNVRLCDDIAEVEEPSTHCVEFRIAQFTHFTHDYLLIPNVAGRAGPSGMG
jgi:hypothetical protein